MSPSRSREAAAALPPELNEKLEEHIRSGLLEIPPLPEQTQRVLAMPMDDENFDPSELGRLIESDPALSAHLLRIANSVFYAPRSPIASLTQAIARLGSKRVREIVVVVTMKAQTFGGRGLEAQLQPRFRIAVSAAFLCQELARLKRLSVEESFLFGMFHNIGEVAILLESRRLADSMGLSLSPERVEPYAAERGPETGATVCHAWKFPPRLVEAIAWQDDPRSAPSHRDAAALASLGATGARGFVANEELAMSDHLAGHAGLDILGVYPDELCALDKQSAAIGDILEIF